ncbi:MAG: nitronate monooxygenase [Actinomycetes bacterium]
MLPELAVPVLAAPMAAGPSTPRLVDAVTRAGGFGFLAAGYKSAAQVRAEIAELRGRTTRPFGVNVFLPGARAPDLDAVLAYRERLRPDAGVLGVEPGEPRWDDDELDDKLAVVAGVPVVSFTFGCPATSIVERLRAAGSSVVVTVTALDEAEQALAVQPDALWLQGSEAGAHRGSFTDEPDTAAALPLLELLAQVRALTDVPLIAAGGLMDGRDIAAALAAGATAAGLGTAFLACPEAGTHPTHRAALSDPRFARTAVTRAFTGRSARGLVNDFLLTHDAFAPRGYPEIHHVTRPLRAAAAASGDADRLHLWAGQGWQRLRPQPAGDLVRLLLSEL